MLTDAEMQPTDRWQRGAAAASIILIAASVVLAVGSAELSWLLALWAFGVLACVFGIYRLRPRLAIQVPLLLALFVWPFVMLAWQRGQWSSMIMLGGLLLPVVIVFAAVWISTRMDRRGQAPDA